MNIVFLTQDEPFYLASALRDLLSRFPSHSKVTGCVLFPPSPFGKKSGLLGKAWWTWRIFGNYFFLRQGLLFLKNRLMPQQGVRHVLEEFNLPILEMEGNINSKTSLAAIRNFKPDLLISIAGNQIFKLPLIQLAPKGCLNLHTALLPKNRGLMPSFWAMAHNEESTGVSVFFVDEGIDSGPIIVQKQILIADKTLDQLIRETKQLGMDAILEAIEKIHSGNYELITNNAQEMTYNRFPTRQDVRAFLALGKNFF